MELGGEPEDGRESLFMYHELHGENTRFVGSDAVGVGLEQRQKYPRVHDT